MTFADFCKEYYKEEFGIHLYDYQLAYLNKFYGEYFDRDPNSQLSIPMDSARSFAETITIIALVAYLDFLKEEENGK